MKTAARILSRSKKLCDNCLSRPAKQLVFLPSALTFNLNFEGKGELCDSCVNLAKRVYGEPKVNEAIYNVSKMRMWQLPNFWYLDFPERVLVNLEKRITVQDMIAELKQKPIIVIREDRTQEKTVGKFRLIPEIEVEIK